MIKITLPWFNPILNPNERSHILKKSKARAKQKSDAHFLALQKRIKHHHDGYALHIVFYPPNRRRRDLDNCLASIKGAIDGIANACNMDDKDFRPITIDFGDLVKHGKITIEMVPKNENQDAPTRN